MDGCASPLDAILEITQLVAFLKKWEVMARLQWTPEANEVVWAGARSCTPVGGMEAATPPTGAFLGLVHSACSITPTFTGPDCLAPFHSRVFT